MVPTPQQWTAFAERQIQRMIEEGKLDNLPGAGKPIPGIDEPYDENWWLKDLLKRERISEPLPETLRIRYEVAKSLESIHELPTESAVRAEAARINARIRRMNATAVAGPMTSMTEQDPERLVADWRALQLERTGA